MKTLLAILILGAVAYFWHRGEITKVTLELDAARAELTRTRDELATAAKSLETAQSEVRTLNESLATASTELTSLRGERDALLAQLNAPKPPPPTPAEIRFDTSPMNSFSYEGTRLIEARITSVSSNGVTVTGKDGQFVVVNLEKAQKSPDLRIRARDAIQAALSGR